MLTQFDLLCFHFTFTFQGVGLAVVFTTRFCIYFGVKYRSAEWLFLHPVLETNRKHSNKILN